MRFVRGTCWYVGSPGLRVASRVGAVLACLLIACGHPSVLVVGLDGANWAALDPLIEAGYLPTIGQLVRAGARAEMACDPAWLDFACYCPAVWTSIATGVPFEDHGIGSLNVPSSERGVKAIWNVVHELGGVVTLASWRGTWPPERGMDFVFTEPGLDVLGHESFEAWAGPEHPGVDYPATLFQPRFLPELLGMRPHAGERPPTWGIYARDRAAMYGLLSLAVARADEDPSEQATELTMVILHGPDKVAHVAWGTIQDEMYGPIDPAPLLAGAAHWSGPVLLPGPLGFGPLAGPYLEADAWLASLLAVRHYDYVVFVSDHGMTRNPSNGLKGAHGPAAQEGHGGIFSVSGPGVEAGATLDPMTVLDVAPTLAYLLDLPVAEDLPGRVLTEAFTPERLLFGPVERTSTWETDPIERAR